jgi:hypothetical protein
VKVASSAPGSIIEPPIEKARRNRGEPPHTAAELREEIRKHEVAVLERLTAREDLRGVPFGGADDCRASPSAANALAEVSSGVREAQSARRALPSQYHNQYPYEERGLPVQNLLHDKSTKWKGEEFVTPLVQTLEVEVPAVRGTLVGHLATIKGAKSSRALAQRAVFDFDARVREQAVLELAKRPAHEFRGELLAAFRYPWRAAAEHAAEALVAVGDRQAIVDLIDLLDAGDPSAPRLNAQHEWVVKELTKVNHLRNCMLCHPPSISEHNVVVGLVPTEGKPLPTVYYRPRSGSEIVRADVAYLRQDFSAMETVKDSRPWPEEQRFDYFVRERKATEREIAAAQSRAESTAGIFYPQRTAILFALEGLTGEMHGDSAYAWRERMSR